MTSDHTVRLVHGPQVHARLDPPARARNAPCCVVSVRRACLRFAALCLAWPAVARAELPRHQLEIGLGPVIAGVWAGAPAGGDAWFASHALLGGGIGLHALFERTWEIGVHAEVSGSERDVVRLCLLGSPCARNPTELRYGADLDLAVRLALGSTSYGASSIDLGIGPSIGGRNDDAGASEPLVGGIARAGYVVQVDSAVVWIGVRVRLLDTVARAASLDVVALLSVEIAGAVPMGTPGR